jgi:CRISPR type IV-associated protein Csf2
MSETVKMVMEGHIYPQTPLATSPPNAPEPRDPDIPSSAQMSGMPFMRVYQHETQEHVRVPYFPASGLRGRIRRAARDVLANGLGEPWSLELHRILSVGGTQHAGHSVHIDVEEYFRQLKSNAFLGLFGASVPSWVEGELSVSPAIPDLQGGLRPDNIVGVRTDSIERNPSETQLLTADALQKYKRIKELFAAKAELEQQKAQAAKDKDNEKQQELDEQIKPLSRELKELQGGETQEKQITGYQAIPPGTPLRQRCALRRVSKVQAGLFLRALAKLSEEPFLGAHVSQGCGLFEAEWEVKILDGDKQIAHCRIEPYIGLDLTGDAKDFMESCISEWNDHVSRMSVEDLENLVTFGRK